MSLAWANGFDRFLQQSTGLGLEKLLRLLHAFSTTDSDNPKQIRRAKDCRELLDQILAKMEDGLVNDDLGFS